MRHCIPCIALAARRSQSGSLCAGHATGSASRWCRLSLRERTKLSRSERRLISPRRFPTTPFESAGVVGEATALLNSKIKAGNFVVKVQEVRLKQQAAAHNAIEARRRAMEEYRTQFAGPAAACAGSAHRGEAPGWRGGLERRGVGAEMEADTATVAEEPRGVDQGGPAEAGTPTSRGVAEESRGVDQGRPAEAGTPTSGTVAEESRGVDQRWPAQAGTPTLRAVAEESRGVDQGGPAEAGTPTSGTVAEESRGVDQGGPAEAGTPTSRAIAEDSRGVDQEGLWRFNRVPYDPGVLQKAAGPAAWKVTRHCSPCIALSPRRTRRDSLRLERTLLLPARLRCCCGNSDPVVVRRLSHATV